MSNIGNANTINGAIITIIVYVLAIPNIEIIAIENPKKFDPQSPIYILADNTKFVEKLGQNFSIPVECFPESVKFVKSRLMKLGAEECILRSGEGKDGPIITENNNLILDVKFLNIDSKLEKKIKLIPGVIESGLFIGYKNIEIIKW